MNTATITEQTKDSITLQVKIKLAGKSMLQMESDIQDALNDVGTLATGEALKKFDTDGKPIILNNERLTVKYR